MTIAFLFILLFGLMALGAPIAISLGVSSLATIMLFGDDSLATLAEKLFGGMEHYTLLAIPYFILASTFLSTGGVARRLIRFAINTVGWFPGGLAMASVLACMLFAAVSGSSPATVVAIGSIVIAGMVRAGYPQSFAAGVICNAGTLGILIPPSIVMVVYAAATEVSVGRMFLAGVIPGIMVGLMLMIAIYIVAKIKKLPSQPRPTFGEWGGAFISASGGLLLVLLIMGGIYGGVFTPTEAAAVAAFYAMIVAVLFYRDMGPIKEQSWIPENGNKSIGSLVAHNVPKMGKALVLLPFDQDIRKVLLDAGKVTIMLMFIIANAMLFAHVLTSERIPHTIAETIIGWGLPAWGFLIVVNIVLLIAGNFMEPSAILLIMAPILFPIAMQLGIDPIHLGIIMVVNMEIGMITPPVGLNLFVTSGITGMPLLKVVKAAFPWLMILLAFLILITYIPEISTWLPNSLMGPERIMPR
ncbi:TRAP transporter large permease [Thalassospira lucentensis]|uniref:TRAP transporter large permease n=1 Tax=Thalassospira lucentensis TaxID=168935 RepID=UPI00142DFC27|nr:TRAP transporter large permease [Thalassospira lucentensis]NIZ03667.1 TRAP transporter large permease [Thalassospira lucentensis]